MSGIETAMTQTRKHQIVIALDDDIYWELVKLGAELQTPIDEYIVNVMVSHAMEQDQ